MGERRVSFGGEGMEARTENRNEGADWGGVNKQRVWGRGRTFWRMGGKENWGGQGYIFRR